MRSRVHAVVLPSEVGDFAEEVRRVFLELGRTFGADALAGQCAPAIDVYETDDHIEITVDLPGVEPQAVRVIAKGESVLIVGEKAVRRGRGESTFHLVERGFGRFARSIRLGHACDAVRARGVLTRGELRISIPKIADRRGRTIQIDVQSA